MNSRSRIFLTTLGGNEAAGLKGPAADSEGSWGVSSGSNLSGVVAAAAAASSSSPDEEGVEMGTLASIEATMVIPRAVVQLMGHAVK